MLDEDEELTIFQQRDKILAGATKEKLLSPATCMFTIEEVYTTIDKVLTESSQQPELLQMTFDDIIYPHSELQGQDHDNNTERIFDTNTNLKGMGHIPKGLLMKQRAVDMFRNDTKDNTAIINKMHHYVDIYTSIKAGLDLETTRVVLGRSR